MNIENRNRFSDYLNAASWYGALTAGALQAGSGFGGRWGLWQFRTGFTMLRWSAYIGLSAAAVAIVSIAILIAGNEKRGFLKSILALGIGSCLYFIPWNWMRLAHQVPPIHDISTDTENPPSFSAILALRKNAANPAEYGGPEIARQQHSAYPDIKTAALPMAPQEVFQRALKAARALKWEIVSADESAGRIEATDTTFWFGFKDDIVIRIQGGPASSRIDIRSVSRVGKSDIGANAKRIRKFLSCL